MIIFFISFLLFFINEQSLANILLDDKNSSVEVIPNNGVLSYNNQKFIGLKISLEKDWKTYWKNPGDAGVALDINFSEDSKINNYKVLFPFPNKFIDHGVITNGYEKEVIYPIKIDFNDDVTVFESNLIVDYLICNKICIPKTEIKKLNLDLVKNTQNLVDSEVYEFLKKVPKSNGNHFDLELVDFKSEYLLYKFKNNIEKEDAKVFVFNENEVNSFDTNIFKQNNEVYLEIKSDEDFENFTKHIYLSVSDGKIYEEHKKNIPRQQKSHIIYYILLAFLGGILLNFMPCVLPILSLKFYSLVNLKDSSLQELRKRSISVILGIIFSFLCLAKSSAYFFILALFSSVRASVYFNLVIASSIKA